MPVPKPINLWRVITSDLYGLPVRLNQKPEIKINMKKVTVIIIIAVLMKALPDF